MIKWLCGIIIQVKVIFILDVNKLEELLSGNWIINWLWGGFRTPITSEIEFLYDIS